jgi:outer membrane protein assembly factor BamB
MSWIPTSLTAALRAPGLAPLWRSVAWVAGLFSALIALGLLLQQLNPEKRDPWKSPELLALKQQLVSEPNNESLKQRIRDLDLRLRQRHAAHLARVRTGRWLLLGGLVVWVVAARQLAALRKTLPVPKPDPEAEQKAEQVAAWSRWAMAATGAGIGLALLTVAFSSRTALSPQPVAAAASDFATATELALNWPRFRGWDGSGVTLHTDLRLTWGTNSTAGIAWKSPIPAPGYNSPIVWGDRVYVSGGTAAKREVFCFDARTGALLWQRPIERVPGSPPKAPEVPESTGFAASTMATDGRRLYVIFANGDLAALGLDGTPVWSKNLGVPKNPYGHSSSLATWQDRLIVQFDQGEGEPGASKLLAFDGPTGRLLWQQSRPVEASWASPIVVELAGRPQIITLAKPWIIAYSPADGAELWRVEGMEGEVAPSPIAAAGLVLAVVPSMKLMAIRPDGAGDVTKTHVVWAAEDSMPDITSPVANDQLVFTVTTPGLLICFDLKTGSKVWEKELDLEFHASPSLVGNRLVLVSKTGVILECAAARQFKELGRSDLGEEVHASPAFAPGRMFIRTVKHLVCIGPAAQALAQQP